MQPNPKGLHHDHIDGSAALIDIIFDLYRMAKKKFPFDNKGAWLEFMRNGAIPIPDRFQTVTGVLQSSEALKLLGYEYGKYRSNEGYTYVEGKFAPQYHIFEGLTLESATRALFQGLDQAEREFRIEIFPHICIGREADSETGVQIAQVALGYDGEVALDLVCDEAENPPEKHLRAYELTFGSDIKRDCHAGEFALGLVGSRERNAQLIQNILTAVKTLRCHGIGHAISLAGVPDLVKLIVDTGVRVSGCPLSNLSEGLISHVGELGIDELLDAGVVYTLNPDDDLFLPPMAKVITACDEAYQFTHRQAEQLENNVFKGAFLIN